MIKSLPTETEEEEFFLLMSLALDGLLDETEQAAFDRSQARYTSLATTWQEWQALHRQMSTIPHAVPTEQFVERFELHLLQQERRQKLRQGFWIGLLTLVLWLGATAGVLSVGTYLFMNQSALLADFVKNIIYFWAAIASWTGSLATAFNTFATTPQAVGLGFGYMLLTMGLLAGWFNYLRRSTQLVEVSVETTAPFSPA